MRHRIANPSLCQSGSNGGSSTAASEASLTLNLGSVALAGAEVAEEGFGGEAPSLSLNSNNSIEDSEKPLPKLTGYAARRAFTVEGNAERFIKKVGVERVGFLTLTFPEPLLDHKEASRRINSLNTNFFPYVFPNWQRVFERTKKGYVHYHLLVECKQDIRSGFNFDLYHVALGLKHHKKPYRHIERQAFRTANSNLRNLWQELRERLPRYGFGRHELMPIRTTAKAAVRYVGKYLSKGMDGYEEDKGVRRIAYSKGQVRSSSNFVWHSSGTKEWRRKVQVLCHFLGLETYDALSEVYGRHWAHFMKDTILDIDQIILGTQRGEYALRDGELIDLSTGQALF